MKIDFTENLNSRRAAYGKQNVQRVVPSFQSKKSLDPEIIKSLNKSGKWWSRFLNYAGENQGEALNILVTAFGTAVICPMFIRYNPFSKEDDKTKAYSAWRQPISAVIAMATQLTITKSFNNWMNKKASTSNKKGEANFTRADLRAKPLRSYLERIIKLEHPEYNNKQIDAEVIKRQIDAEKQQVERYRKLYQNKEVNPVDMISTEYASKTEEQILNNIKTENKAEIEAKFGKPLNEIKDRKLKKYLDEKLLELAKKSDIENKDSLKPDKLKELFVQKRALENIHNEVVGETILKSYIRHLKKNGMTVDKAIQQCTPENIVQFIKSQNLNAKFDTSAEQIANEIVKKLEKIKSYECEHKLKDFTSVKDLGKNFEEIMKNVQIKKIVRAKCSDAQKVFKTKNTQLGILVTFITLPFSCGLLNWAYPRIMEKIMPEMSASKDKKDVKKEGDD